MDRCKNVHSIHTYDLLMYVYSVCACIWVRSWIFHSGRHRERPIAAKCLCSEKPEIMRRGKSDQERLEDQKERGKPELWLSGH